MRNTAFLLMAFIVAFPVLTSTGCNTSAPDDQAGHDDGHGHDHGDSHGHESGPHNGHLVELGEEEAYHLEWVDNDEDKTVAFYILDAEAQAEVPISANAITVTLAASEDASRDYEIMAVRSGEEEKSAHFLTDQAEFFTMLMSDGVKAKVNIDIEGTKYEGEFEAGGHHHHH